MFVPPMLLQKLDASEVSKQGQYYDDESLACELKADGIRILYCSDSNSNKLYSRHGNELTQYKELLSLNLPFIVN